MNVKFLNPFVDAAFEVLQKETHTEIKRGDLGLDKAPYVTDDVTCIIAMVGQIQGTVFYSMDKKTGVSLASEMMGEELTDFDNLAQSGIAELGNIITEEGKCKTVCSRFRIDHQPPDSSFGKRCNNLDTRLPQANGANGLSIWNDNDPPGAERRHPGYESGRYPRPTQTILINPV